jgi:recombination DNA repair RAD52 pathway protein
MSFSVKQVRALRRDPRTRYVRQREHRGRTFSYVESWYAINEANRIFGFDSWDRETVETRNVVNRENRGTFVAVYVAKVRITVRTGNTSVVREGHGSGEGRGSSPGEAHDLAIKAAETDATKRALATFGRPFGLGLYLKESSEVREKVGTKGADLNSARLPESTRALPTDDVGSEVHAQHDKEGCWSSA